MADPTETQAEAATAAEAMAELLDDAGREHEFRMARLAHQFLTNNVPGLGQIEKGDEEKWAEINLLGPYKPVERAYVRAAVEALELLSHAFRGARRP